MVAKQHTCSSFLNPVVSTYRSDKSRYCYYTATFPFFTQFSIIKSREATAFCLVDTEDHPQSTKFDTQDVPVPYSGSPTGEGIAEVFHDFSRLCRNVILERALSFPYISFFAYFSDKKGKGADWHKSLLRLFFFSIRWFILRTIAPNKACPRSHKHRPLFCYRRPLKYSLDVRQSSSRHS